MDRGCLGKRDSQEKLSANELRYLAKVEISSLSLSCSTAEEKRKEPGCCTGEFSGVRSPLGGPFMVFWGTSTYRDPQISETLMVLHSPSLKPSEVTFLWYSLGSISMGSSEEMDRENLCVLSVPPNVCSFWQEEATVLVESKLRCSLSPKLKPLESCGV